MRVIDADAFKSVLNSGGGESTDINISKSMQLSEIVDTVIHAYRKCLFAELEKMPTAYDVDKVVEQLEKLPTKMVTTYTDPVPVFNTDRGSFEGFTKSYEIKKEFVDKDKAIKIVRAGMKK